MRLIKDQTVSVAMLENKTDEKEFHQDSSPTIWDRIENAWHNATIEPVYFFFLTAYMLQTFLVETYIEDDLKLRYNVSSCMTPNGHMNDSMHERTFSEECREEYEKENGYWDLILLIIYAAPALILAPVLGSWTDGLHRVIPMYTCAMGMTLSSMCMGISILRSASIATVVLCTLPSGLSGGEVLFSLAMYSYEAEKHNNFEIFESYLTLQFLLVTAKTFVQFLIHYSSTKVAKAALIWGPFLFSFIALSGLIHRRIKDNRPMKFKFCQFTFIHMPIDFCHMIRVRLLFLHFLLFICAFVFYLAYVGETAEIMHILNSDEPWQIASFTIYGAVQDVTKSIGLLVTIFFWKNIIHKKIIDKQLLPHFSVFILGILGFVSDMVAKLIITVTPDSSIQYWEPLIGVISELAIVVVRYFLVLLVSKNDVGKVLSLVAIAQILSTIPSSILAKFIQSATLDWWPNFVYFFLALIQFVPIILLIIIMKFSHLPDIDLHPPKVEEDKNMKISEDDEQL